MNRQYRVDVTVGRRTRESFVTHPDDPDDAGHWYRLWLPMKRVRKASRHGDSQPQPTQPGYVPILELLGSDPDATMPLSEGFRPKEITLAVIFEAARSGDIRKIDLKTLKSVDSQWGWKINNLSGLSEENRRLAKQALYTEIVRAL